MAAELHNMDSSLPATVSLRRFAPDAAIAARLAKRAKGRQREDIGDTEEDQ
jgi:hypothetical protein